MNRNRTGLLRALLIGAAVLAAPAHASERRLPIELEADRAEMSQTTGTGVYTGNVVLTQGDMVITGDRMTVYTSATRELERVVVEGNLAEFERRQRDAQPVRARAPRMEYHAGEREHVILSGGATLWQGRNEFTGDNIHYDLAAETVVAKGEGERRTRITFFPREEESDDQ